MGKTNNPVINELLEKGEYLSYDLFLQYIKEKGDSLILAMAITLIELNKSGK